MSCSSRAIRRRSSATARSASRVRRASASCCQRRTSSPVPTTRRTATVLLRTPVSTDISPWPPLINVSGTVARAAAAVTAGPRSRVTVYSATAKAAEKCVPCGVVRFSATPRARTAQSTVTGLARRPSTQAPPRTTRTTAETVVEPSSVAPSEKPIRSFAAVPMARSASLRVHAKAGSRTRSQRVRRPGARAPSRPVVPVRSSLRIGMPAGPPPSAGPPVPNRSSRRSRTYGVHSRSGSPACEGPEAEAGPGLGSWSGECAGPRSRVRLPP